MVIESELFKSKSLQVNNLFDEKYVNNAWVYRFKSDSYDLDLTTLTLQLIVTEVMIWLVPQAKRNLLIGLSLGETKIALCAMSKGGCKII